MPGLSRDSQGSYLSLRDTQVVLDEVTVASGLRDGTHLLELRTGSTGPATSPVAINRLLIGRQQPFSWTASFLLAAGLIGLFAGLFRLARSAAIAAGWLAEPDRPPPSALPWWDTRE